MLQHPISTDCNSDGIPISSRRNPETISMKHRSPQKTPRQEKYLQRYYPSHSPSPTPFSYAPLSRLIARNLLAFTLTPTSFIMRYFHLLFFENRHRNRYRQSYAKTMQRYNHILSYCQTLSDIDNLWQTSAPIKLKETTLLRFNLPISAIYPFTETRFKYFYLSWNRFAFAMNLSFSARSLLISAL